MSAEAVVEKLLVDIVGPELPELYPLALVSNGEGSTFVYSTTESQ
jgi:hypothetical protein